MFLTTRRRFIEGAATLAAAGVAAPFVRKANAAEFTFKAATGLISSHPTNVRLGEASKKILEETGGKLEIKVFPNSQLGGDRDLLNQIYSGAVEIYLIGGLVLSQVVTTAALDGTGFVFKDYPQVWKAMDGTLGSYIREAIIESGLYVMPKIWDLGFRQITSNTHPIETVDDLAGFKIRVPSAVATSELFKALGSAPVSLQYPELYSALQTGIVDGQENPLSNIATSKFYEVQKFCSMTNHTWNGFWCLINGAAWKRLPADVQEIAEKHLNEAGLNQRQDLARLDETYRQTMLDGGIKFNEVDTDSFRRKLAEAEYYKKAQETFGEKGWKLLQEASDGAI